MNVTLFRKEWKATLLGTILLTAAPISLAFTIAIVIQGLGLALDAVAGSDTTLLSPSVHVSALRNLLTSLSQLSMLALLPMVVVSPFYLASARFAGERGNGTIHFLDTLPVSKGRVLLAKYLAGFSQYLLIIILYSGASLALLHWSTASGSMARSVVAQQVYSLDWLLYTVLGAVTTFTLFAAASLLFDSTAKASLGGLALYAAYSTWSLWIMKNSWTGASATPGGELDIPAYRWQTVAPGLFLALVLFSMAALAWIRDWTLRFNWRAVAVIVFLIPAAITTWAWAGFLLQDVPRIIEPTGYFSGSVEAIAVDQGHVWIKRDYRTIELRTLTPSGLDLVRTINVTEAPDRIGAWGDFLVGIAHTYQRGSERASQFLVYQADGRVDTWELTTDASDPFGDLDRNAAMASSAEAFALLRGGRLHLFTRGSDSTIVMNAFAEDAYAVGFNEAGDLVVLRATPVPRDGGTLVDSRAVMATQPVQDPVLWVYARSDSSWLAPRKANTSDLERAMMANGIMVRDGKIYTTWMPTVAPSEGGRSIKSARIPDGRIGLTGRSVFTANWSVTGPSVLGAPVAMNVTPLGSRLWSDSRGFDLRSLFGVLDDVAYRVVWPRTFIASMRAMEDFDRSRGMPSTTNTIKDFAVDGNRVYVLSRFGILWLDLDRLNGHDTPSS